MGRSENDKSCRGELGTAIYHVSLKQINRFLTRHKAALNHKVCDDMIFAASEMSTVMLAEVGTLVPPLFLLRPVIGVSFPTVLKKRP